MNGWHRRNPDSPAAQARRKQYASRQHRDKVKQYRALIDSGHATCWRCTLPIPPGSPFHAGHDDDNRQIYRGPEHPDCNLKAAARKGQHATQHRPGRRTPRRNWYAT